VSRASELAPAPFVVGVPRSGTTLLRLQLDSHPELALPAETGFGDVARRFEKGSVTRADLLHALTSLPTWADLAMGRDELADLLAEVDDWDLSAGLRAFYRGYAHARGKARYGDKTPGHAAQMDVLSRVLPEARFIHIIRDGRDVAASLRGLPFAPGDGGMAAIAAAWRDTIWRARRAAAQVPHYAEVRYEELVSEPDRVLRELCGFLELDFVPEMLRAHERARDRLAEMRSATVGVDGVARLSDGTEMVARTLKPPDADRVGRWRHSLSEHDVARFERLAGGALADAGYRPYERASTAAIGLAADTNSGMRVVLGRQTLATLGGVATYALTVARELERLGHEVTLVTEEQGVAADVAAGRGIHVTALSEAPAACDATIAHDLPTAAALAARYPDARRVFVAHSDGWDLELPPLAPGLIHAVIACSDRMAARVRALPLKAPIVRLREPIDTDAYLFPKALPERPGRALIVSNYLQGERRRMLRDAWEGAGIECVHAGTPADVVVDMASALARADIVVGKARAALEAMCAGCAVYVFDQYGGDGWVTPENYPAFESDHFSGQVTAGPRTGADLVADLDGYNPDMGIVNHELVRSQHGARHHAMELVAVLRGAYVREPDEASVAAEVARVTRAWGRAELRSAELWSRMEAAEARATEAERDLDEARRVLETKRVRAGIALGRAADRLRSRT
jgi:Sulfotransferase family